MLILLELHSQAKADVSALLSSTIIDSTTITLTFFYLRRTLSYFVDNIVMLTEKEDLQRILGESKKVTDK